MPQSPMARFAGIALVLAGAGCEAAPDSEAPAGAEATGVQFRDSAGVLIVENPGPADDRPSPRGELVQPARRVFGSETEGPELFGEVSARLHPDGSLWISELQTQEVRVFDPGSGEHLFTIGGEGDGPGEFRQSRFLGFDAAGSAYVYDFRHRRLSVFSEGGGLRRSHPMPSSLGFGPRPDHVTRAGALLGRVPRIMERKPADGSTARDTVRIWTLPLDGAAPALLTETPGALWYFRNGTQVVVPHTGILPPPYTGGPLHGFRDDRIYVTDHAAAASYSVYGPAGLERRVEIDRAPRRVEDFPATMFFEHMRRSRFPESRVRFYEEHLPEMPIPETRRTWEHLVVTDEGGAWLLRAGDAEGPVDGTPAEDRVWDVFDPEGVLAGHVRTPANVSPVQVSGRSVVTIVSDEMGRRTVAIHDVRWTGSGRPDG